MPKKPLDLLAALSKSGPKSRNMSGVSDASISAPDQGGDMMAPGGDMVDDMGAMPQPEESAEAEGENCITLPQGFKAPDGSEDGKPFTTTVRGKIMDGKFYAESIGDMPLNAQSAAAEPAEEEGDAAQPTDDYAQKKADEQSAKSVFQPGR